MITYSKRFILIVLTFLIPCLHAEIIEINEIDNIRPYVTDSTLCLFDIDDTLINTPFQLGSPPWRRWAKPRMPYHPDFVMHDIVTLYIAKNALYKAVEPSTPQLIADLQENGIAVFAFTARGQSIWYVTNVPGLNRFTHDQLNHVGIDFRKTVIPNELKLSDSPYFFEGIIFSEHIKKGELFKQLFEGSKYLPTRVIFVDDKLEQVQSMESAFKEVGIEFYGFWYRRGENDNSNFDPVITNIQLEALLQTGEIIRDETAIELAKTRPDKDPEATLKEILYRNTFKLDKI